MSDLVYDHATKQITLRGRDGVTIGAWAANNNVDSQVGLPSLPNGVYRVRDSRMPHRHGRQGGDFSQGSYGPAGIVRLDDFVLDGRPHQGVGIHSGRKLAADGLGRTGVDHCTLLCIRTTDVAMSMITQTMTRDPLNTLLVRNSAAHGKFVHTAPTNR
jgi:hypothetical protein